jgi:uncharacterized protein
MAGKDSFAERFGPWAVVTGASSGIGRAIAIQLGGKGLNVFLVGRDRGRLEATATAVRKLRVQAEVLVADFEDPHSTKAVIDATAALRVGLFVPAAGFGDAGAFTASDLAVQQAMLQVNIASVMTLVHHFARQMCGQGRGGIVLMASLVGFHGAPYAANYAATKAYVQCFGEALAVELKGAGVQVLVSAPGPTDSGFADRARTAMGRALKPEVVASATLAALGRTPRLSATVLPGFLTIVLRSGLMMLPRFARVRIIGTIMKGFSEKYGWHATPDQPRT